MKKKTFLIFAFCLYVSTLTQAQTMIASYPLTSDLSDVTATYSDMTLTGLAAPAGSLCQSTVYPDNGTTPYITALDETSFQIDLDFNLTTIGASTPIIVGGTAWRWIGIYVNSVGQLGIVYNNISYEWSNTTVNAGLWYSASLKLHNNHVILELDGVTVYENCLTPLVSGGDYNFSTTHFGNSQVLNGCIKNLNLYNIPALPMITTLDIQTICAGESVTVGTNTYNATGVYVDTVTMMPGGCLNEVTTDLTVLLPITTSSQTLTVCAEGNVVVGANTYNTTGIYMDTLTTANGCDSTVITDLTVSAAITSSQTLIICAEDNVVVGANTYNTTGVYTDTLTAINGCDSVVVTDLTVNTVDVGVFITGLDLIADAVNATYQWVDCNDSNAPITGETNATYSATENGSYAVLVTENGCTEMSTCIEVTEVGITENVLETIAVYPNPTAGTFTISNDMNMQMTVHLIDLSGKVVYSNSTNETTNTLNISHLIKGLYFLQMQVGEMQNTVKLIKQ